MPSVLRSHRIVSAFRACCVTAMLITPTHILHAEDNPVERTITVSASVTAEAAPDLARITSGVTTEADTARYALTKNSETMEKIITGLKAKSIDPKDIQTASFNVEPVFDYSKEGQPPRLRGYRVSNQVIVLVRQLDQLGEVLDDVVSDGANQIQGLAFEFSKEDALKDDARKEAVANALRRAKLLAAAAGASVGDVLQISEEFSSGPPVMYARLAKAAPTPAAPIETGTSTLEARVTVTWALK